MSAKYFELYKEIFFKFPITSLQEVIKQQKESILIQDNQEYKRCRVQLYAKGIELRDIVKGSEIKTKKQQVCKANQFLVAEIDAKMGGYGIVPENLNGAVVSSHYFLYNINTDKLLPSFLGIYVKTDTFHKQIKAIGSTNYAAIRPYQVLEYEIPLPPLTIQNQLVSDYQARLQQASQAEQQASQLEQGIETYLLDALGIEFETEKPAQTDSPYKFLQMVDFKDIIEWGVDKILLNKSYTSSKYTLKNIKESNALIDAFRGKSPVYEDNAQSVILNQKCNRWNELKLEYSKTVSEKWFSTIDNIFKTCECDILINSTGEGTIGRSSFVTKEYENLIYDSHILLLRLDQNKVNSLFLVYQFNSSFGQGQINQIKSAQSTKQTELGLENLFKIRFALPPLPTQNEIVAHINTQKAEIKRLKAEAERLRQEAKEAFEREIFN